MSLQSLTLQLSESDSFLLQAERQNRFFNSKAPKVAARFWSIISLVCMASLAIWGLIDLGLRTHTYLTRPDETCYCGTTPEEGISRGCTYDHLASAWLPEHCRDLELSRIWDDIEQRHHHNWTFYTYPDFTRQLSIQEVSMMGMIPKPGETGRVGTTQDWHVSHCLFLWHKLARAKSTGTTMAPRHLDEHHITHCVFGILKRLEYWPGYLGLSATEAYMFPRRVEHY